MKKSKLKFYWRCKKIYKIFKTKFLWYSFQDAFSSDVNFELWTKEYFEDIYKIANDNFIMSSYAIATPIRLSMYEANFLIYEHRPVKEKLH